MVSVKAVASRDGGAPGITGFLQVWVKTRNSVLALHWNNALKLQLTQTKPEHILSYKWKMFT